MISLNFVFRLKFDGEDDGDDEKPNPDDKPNENEENIVEISSEFCIQKYEDEELEKELDKVDVEYIVIKTIKDGELNPLEGANYNLESARESFKSPKPSPFMLLIYLLSV